MEEQDPGYDEVATWVNGGMVDAWRAGAGEQGVGKRQTNVDGAASVVANGRAKGALERETICIKKLADNNQGITDRVSVAIVPKCLPVCLAASRAK